MVTKSILRDQFELGKSLPTGELFIPSEVTLSEDSLLWTFGPRSRRVRPPSTLLQDFLALADAPPERIRDFAAKWGVLETCKHNLPASHNPLYIETHGPNRGSLMGGCPALDEWGQEPDWEECGGRDSLEVWRHFARQGRAALKTVHQLQLGRTARLEDLEALFEWESGFDVGGWKRSLGSTKKLWMLVGGIVHEWLRIGDVRPYLAWRGNRELGGVAPLDFRLGGGMFGTLAVQLLFSVFKTEGLAICSDCGSHFIPKRRPNLTRRAYCPGCSKGGRDKRDASRAYRDRKKIAVTLANEGIPTKEIAKRVGSQVKTVEGWLQKVARDSKGTGRN